MPGERLPSEDELSIRFHVSRMTVRRALDQLVSQGRLRRVQGRGTFVAEQTPQPKATGITRWSFERIDRCENETRQILRIEEVSPSLRVANALRTMPGEMVVQISGILYDRDQHLGYFVHRIPRLIVPTIDSWELGQDTLPCFLAKRCSLEFGKVTERVRVISAEEDAVELLGVEPGDPVLYVDSLVFLVSGIPVILSDTAYRGDRYVYCGLLHPLMDETDV